jgi:hypothetical protein
MSLVALSGNVSGTGTLTIAAPNTNSNYTLTLPTNTATLNINGPAFSYWASGATSIPNATFTKVLFATQEFDTASAVSSSRFTPTVAGYYQINASVYYGNNASAEKLCAVYKNGTQYKNGQDFTTTTYGTTVNCIVYLNGSTDYVEIYAYQTSGGTLNTNNLQVQTYFQGVLVRGA